MHFLHLAIANNLRIIFVRNDKATRGWNKLARKGLIDGKIEAVAELKVLLPFVIGYEIITVGFNFHDCEGARSVERDDIRAPTVFQAELTDTDLA